MKRSFGFVAGPATRSTVPNLDTSEGLIEHSRRHGAIETMAAVAERGAKPNAPKQAVELATLPDGERVVVRGDDMERIRNRPRTQAQLRAHLANEQFLRDTNPNREQQQREAAQKPMRRIDVGKRKVKR